MGTRDGLRTITKLALIYSIALSLFTCLRHEMFMTRAYDLGIFMQALWTTLFEGKFFYETPDIGISTSGSFFGVHFSLMMFLLLGLYWVFPHAYTLLILQSFLLGFAAVPLYKLAKRVLGEDNLALAFSAIYFVYPPILAANLFDFHLEAFFPIVFFYAFYYLEKEEFTRFYLMLFFALMILDFASVIFVISTAFYASYIKYYKKILRREFDDRVFLRHFILCNIMIIMAVVYFQVCIAIIEKFGTRPFSKTLNWPDLGTNIHEILIGIFNPYKVMRALSYDFTAKLLWLIMLLLPLLFAPIFDPLSLIPGLPWILVAFLSRYGPYYQLGWQYGAIYTPFIFYAGLRGFNNLLSDRIFNFLERVLGSRIHFIKRLLRVYKVLNRRRIATIAGSLSIITIILGLTLRPLAVNIFVGSAYADPLPIPNEHTAYLHRILSYIPPNASVLAQNNIFPHVAHRINAYVWIPPNMTDFVDYAIGDVQHPEFYMVIPNNNFTYDDIFYALITSGNYRVYAAADGIILLKKGYQSDPVLFIPIHEIFDYRRLKYYSTSVKRVEGAISSRVLVFQNKPKGSLLWYGPYIGLPPGDYLLTVRIKIALSDKIDLTRPVLKIKIYGYDERKTISIGFIYFADVMNRDWVNVTFFFKVIRPDVFEFKGISLLSNATIYLDFISLEQLSIYP